MINFDFDRLFSLRQTKAEAEAAEKNFVGWREFPDGSIYTVYRDRKGREYILVNGRHAILTKIRGKEVEG